MKRISAVFFDLYGTLVVDNRMNRANERWALRLGERIEASGAEAPPAEELFRAFWGKPMPPGGRSATPFVARLGEFFGELGASLPPTEAPSTADELCAVWQQSLPIAEDAVRVIGSLRDRYRVAVVSNFGHPPHVRALLAAEGIDGHLDALIISGDYPFEKPDPRLLLEGCREVRSDPEETVYVGDSIVDYRAAVAAGITPILIRRLQSRPRWPDDGRPDPFAVTDRELEHRVREGALVQVSSLSEVPPAVEALELSES